MGGKKGGGSRSPRIDKNTLNSAQKLKVVDLISSGEIAGFINGNENPLKSVYLNDTPVQNEDGSMNHAGVQFEFNNGAVDQDYLPSLSSIDNSVSVGVEVEKKNPITRTVTNQQVTSVRVTVGVDALMHSTKEGDQLATSVDMSIQIIKNGNIYASEHMHLNEKGNQPFRLDYVFSNLPTAPFDIRCVRITEDSNDDMLRNKTYFFSYVESIDIKVRMPGSAVAMLQIDSQQFGSNNPTRNYGINGCIVQVPSNYDPVERTYTGMWDRLFKPAFTNNPAWVLYDVLTADECLGEKFKDYRIDIDRLYELSKYSDNLVDDGNGGKEPRFVCNMVLFGDDASTVLDNICSIFRGTYSSANNHFTVQFDQKSDPVVVYNNSSVENGEFNYSYVPATELFNQIKVEYIDKFDGYRTKIDEVSDESNIAKYGLRSTSITAFGATKRSYALRCAKWNLVTALTENETVTFVLGAAGIRHEQHDIIKIADNDYAGAQIGGRIESVDGNIITVDRELKNVKEFMINIDGSVKTFQVIKAIDAKTYQLDSAVNAVDYVQFVATLNNLEPRLFRCIHIEEDSEVNKYTVTAIKHNPQKEAIVDKGAEYIEGNHSILNTLPHLSNGVVTTEGKAIILRWDSLETIGSETKYIVHLYNGTTLVRRIETKETFVRLENLPQGNYTARIRAINQLGQYSEELHISFSTTYEISGLRFNALPLEIHLFWQVPGLLTSDAVTEIWMSKKDDFTTATLFAKTVYPQSDYRITGLSVGDKFYFWFRLVDLDGNQGEFTRALKAMPSDDASAILSIIKGKITETELGDDVVNGIIKDVIDSDDLQKEIQDVLDDSIGDLDEKIAGIIDQSDVILKINQKITQSEAELQVLNLTQASSSHAHSSYSLLLNSKTDNNSAKLQVMNLTESSSVHALSSYIVFLKVETDGSISQIKQEQSVFADSLSAQAKSITELSSKVGENASSIAEIKTSTATALESQSQSITQLNSKVENNSSSITNLDKTTTDRFKAQSESINQVNTKVGENTASITEAKKTIATVDGKVESTYSLTANANGQITGFKFGTDGDSSVFNIMADSFVISNQVNEEVVTPFIWSQNKLVLDGDLIATGSVSGDKISANTSITAPIIKGGRIESGHIAGGRIDIGNGNFTVDPDGNLNANHGYFGGTIEASEIKGDVVKAYSVSFNSNGLASITIPPESFNRILMTSGLVIKSVVYTRDGSRTIRRARITMSSNISTNKVAMSESAQISMTQSGGGANQYVSMLPSRIFNIREVIPKNMACVISFQGNMETLLNVTTNKDEDVSEGDFVILTMKD